MTDKTIIAILVSGLLIAILFGGYNIKKNLNYTREVKKQYELKLSDLKEQLQQSESVRQRLRQDGVILHNRYVDLLRQDSLLVKKMDSIRGRFDHLTPSELQDAMIKEHKRFAR